MDAEGEEFDDGGDAALGLVVSEPVTPTRIAVGVMVFSGRSSLHADSLVPSSVCDSPIQGGGPAATAGLWSDAPGHAQLRGHIVRCSRKTRRTHTHVDMHT